MGISSWRYGTIIRNFSLGLDTNILTVGDTAYNSYNGATIDYNTTNTQLGDTVEASVAGILWDIFDNDDTEIHDTASLSHMIFWYISQRNNPKTLSDFICSLNDVSNMPFLQKVGEILTYYKVASSAPVLSNASSISQTAPPTFTWIPQGSSSLNNNRFNLVIYDESETEVLRTANLTTNSYTLTQDQWNSILNNGRQTYYVTIASSQTTDIETGPYYSGFTSIDFWASMKYKITNVGAGKCLNINGDNVTSLSNGINVTLWSDSGTNEQKWIIETNTDYSYIKSVIDTSYGLNVYRSGSPYNCNIYAINGNETDAQIDLIPTSNGYKIKLHNYNLYLTVNSSSNGTNVYWAAFTGSDYQYWDLTLT